MCAKCKYASSCRIHVLGILLLLLLGILESNEYFVLQSQLFAVHNLNKSALLSIKARANACNIVGQQDATLLGPTCCERLHTMLCVVACCCDLLEVVG